MSLFDDASLVYIPTGYKATKNYSGKPSTGGADMTFSRASGATRVNSKGLVEKVRTNLLLQSNTFNTTWTQQNTTLTSGQSGYDGSSDAWKVEATSAATTRLLQSSSIAANTVVTVSLYAKVGNVDFIKFNLAVSGTNSIATFDLTDGTIYNSNAIDTTWKEVGNGWVRISATFINSNVIIEPRIELRSDYTTDVADAGSYVYIQDAQLEYGLVATNYIETTSAAVSVGPVNDEPRLTYDPVNPTAPSLLMEPQRTNLFEYSEYMNGLDLIQATTTENAETSPEGVVNAARLYDNTTDAQHRVGDNAISVTSGTTYTLSVFAKKGTLRYCYLLSTASASTERYFFDLQEGTAITSGGTIEDYGNGWYRLSAQSTASATGNAAFAFNLTNEDQDNTYVGTGTDYHIVYGLQLEAGSYPTSYIPTNGTSVTRVADASSKTGISDLIGQTEGTLFLDFVWNGLGTASVDNPMFSIGLQEYGTSNIAIANYNGALYGRVTVSTTIEANIAFGAMVAGTRYKAALAYANNDVIFYVNGLSYGSDTSATIPATSSAYLQNAYPNAKKVNKAFLFPTRLDNATLATLTSL